MDKNTNLLSDVPMGFGMALAENMEAMERFSKMSREQKQKVLDGTHQICSKQEMKSYVNQIAGNGIM